MKRIIYVAVALMIVFSLSACGPDADDYISGISFDPADYNSANYETYENQLYGIIIEYPENCERVGNYDIDGYITFENKNVAISAYRPDTENNHILTAEEYVKEILKIEGEEGSGITKYGRCSGYKTVTHDNEGNVRIDFVVKGVDAFYRFAYTTAAQDFTEEDSVFQYVMSSIRIDDGEYNRLTRMANRYTVLLEYATSMQYITDANYANHCLNSYEQSEEEYHKTDALKTSAAIREEIGKILSHEREESEEYDELWNKIIEDAEAIVVACEEAEACVASGDYEEAKKIARTRFTYDLSDNASKFIATINAEIAEY